MRSQYLIFFALITITACTSSSEKKVEDKNTFAPQKDSLPPPETKEPEPGTYYTADSQFIDVSILDPSIKLDIRYATENNFVKEVMYDCSGCLLRPEVALAVKEVHEHLKSRGLGGLKLFDCYRPRPVQQKLWEKVPNPQYVTDPKKGSMHNRGAAVDLTILDADGNELDMGTTFDFFGKKAHHDFTDLPEIVLDNRNLLKQVMENAGFASIRTEWWHYSYTRKTGYQISDYLWDCK